MSHPPSRYPGSVLPRACLILMLLLVSSVPTALADQASPSPGADTRTYIGHAGGFVARIPADWTLDRSLDYDYAGPDGFVSTDLIALSRPSVDSLDTACASVAEFEPFAGQSAISFTTWRSRPACIVRTSDEQSADPVALVFARPKLSPLGEVAWIAIIIDAEHFGQVTRSISFDTSGVTPAMFLDSTLDLLEGRSLWRDAVDWDDLRQRAHALLANASDTEHLWAAHPAIDLVIAALRDAGADRHTVLIPASQLASIRTSQQTYWPPTGVTLEDGVGYLNVPGFTGSSAQSERYVATLHELIEDSAPASDCGWIVDLRGDGGGLIGPMVGGLAPLLPPGRFLVMRDVSGGEDEWSLISNGAIEVNGRYLDGLPGGGEPLNNRLDTVPVAVLIGPYTASAGEATAIAFTGRDRTAFFGEPTADVASGPVGVRLLDGSLLRISTAWMVGPHGAIYPEGIAPDVAVTPSTIASPITDDPVVREAAAWLLQQPGCDESARFSN